MKKYIVATISILLLLTGCSDKDEASTKEKTKEETKEETKEVTQEQTNKSENQELTNKLKKESVVQEALVYEQNGVMFGTFVVNDKASVQDAVELAEEYAEILKSEYGNLEVRVSAEKNGKKVANIMKNKETNVTTDSDIKKSETVDVNQLLEEGIVTFKLNFVSQQLSLLLDSTKLTGALEGKKDSELVLLVGTETFDFKSNIFKPTQFDVANTDYSKTELTKAKILIK